MEVKRVQATQTSQTFTGYVGKSVKTYINSAVSASMDRVIERANDNHKPVDIKELQRLKQLGQEVLDKIEKFVSSMHKKSSIEFESTYGGQLYKNFIFKNRLMHENVDLKFNYKFKEYFKTFNSDRPAERELCELNRSITELADNVNPQDIDKALLTENEAHIGTLAKHATNLFKRLVVRYKANRVKQFANQISEPVGDNITYIDNLLNWAKVAKTEDKDTAKYNKRIIKENYAAKKRVLKG